MTHSRRPPILVLLATLLLLTAQKCPDFTVDDHDGEVPGGLLPSEKVVSASASLPVPPPLQCGETRTFENTQYRAVGECEGFDFKQLHGFADLAAAEQAHRTKCPDKKCLHLYVNRSFQSWSCGGTPAKATATVQYTADCHSGEGIEVFLLPPDLAAPKDADLAAPNPNGIGTAEVPADQVTTEPYPKLNGCNPPEVVRFEYTARVEKRPPSLEPYVATAERFAEWYYQWLFCNPGCTKQEPFKPVRREWSWAAGTVTVVIQFVPCR